MKKRVFVCNPRDKHLSPNVAMSKSATQPMNNSHLKAIMCLGGDDVDGQYLNRVGALL